MTDVKLAETLGITPRAVLEMKKKTPERYEMLRSGAICKENDISSKDLELFAEFKEKIIKAKQC